MFSLEILICQKNLSFQTLLDLMYNALRACKLAPRSLGDQVWYLFYGACSQAIAFQILFDLALDQSTFWKAIINEITSTLIGRLKEVQLSSAYCESLTSLCLPTAIPFISSERLILWASNSIAIMNNVPESGQPWRTPRSRWNCFETYPLFKTQLEISV